jgi:predicted TIM-barrel fold metal-dependent hydrolase
MNRRLPVGSWDCQIHVYGDPARYPSRHENPLYSVPPETIAEAQRMHSAIGADRCIIVQATIYKTDHALLKDVLRSQPRDRYRGVAIIGDDTSDAELADLHDAGVRAARFNFHKGFALAPSLPEFHRSIARIRELGWFAKVFTFGDEILELDDEFRKVKVPLVVDHMGRLDFGAGVDQSACRLIVERLKEDGWWIMLSNGDRCSRTGPAWDDAIPFARAFFEAAPDRCIWATDWPHVNYGGPVPPDADLADLVLRYFPDAGDLERVLCENPSRLVGASEVAIP